MGGLFPVAYLGELALWVPLAAIVVAVPGMRRWLAAPIGVSALAMAYEGFMTFVWAPTVVNPIRVDVFLVMAVAGVVDMLTGLALVKPARSGVHRRHATVAAALCFLVPALAIVGFVGMHVDSAAVGGRLDDARRFRFEAAFRDEATQRRFFGELSPNANPWAGYYRVEGKDDRFRHLVINDAGRVWIYHEQLYAYAGSGSAVEDEFRGELAMPASRAAVVLRRARGDYELEVRGPHTTAKLPARRSDPPRFAAATTSRDEVRFLGVYAGTYENPPGFAWVIQVWLWQAGGEAWGQYLREPLKDGDIGPYLAPQAIASRCEGDCATLEFKTGRGDVSLRRVSPDEWRAKVAGHGEEVALRRGERIEGFDLDLAPVASVKANRGWLEAMTTGLNRREPGMRP